MLVLVSLLFPASCSGAVCVSGDYVGPHAPTLGGFGYQNVVCIRSRTKIFCLLSPAFHGHLVDMRSEGWEVAFITPCVVVMWGHPGGNRGVPEKPNP